MLHESEVVGTKDLGRDMTAGVVLAGGKGTRLQREAMGSDKPLLPVAGAPVISWVLDDMRAAGLTTFGVVCRPQQRVLQQWLLKYAESHHISVTILAGSHDGTLSAVAAGIGWGPGTIVLSTCDVAAPRGTTRRLLAHASRPDLREVAAFLATTTIIHGLEPIWVLSNADGFVTDVGKNIKPTTMCFGHMQVIRPSFRGLFEANRSGLCRGTELLGMVARNVPRSLYGVECGHIIDVNEPEDVPPAEAILATQGSSAPANRIRSS